MDIPFPQNISVEELISCNFLVNFKCSICADVVNKFVADITKSFPPIDTNKLKLLCTIIIAEQLPIDISNVNGIKGDIRLCPECDCQMDRLVILERELLKLWNYFQTRLRLRCRRILGKRAVPGTSPTLAARMNYFHFSTSNQMGKFNSNTIIEDSPAQKEMHCDSSVEVIEETHNVSMQTEETSSKSKSVGDDANNNLRINEHLTRSPKVSDIDTTLQNNVFENDTEDDEVTILEDEVVKMEEADVGTVDEVTRMEEEVKTGEAEESGQKREMVELVTESGTQLVAVEPTAAFDEDPEKSKIQTIVLKETGIAGTYGIVEGTIKANPQIRLEEEMNVVKFETVEDLLNEATYSVIAAPDLQPDTTYVYLPGLSGNRGMLVPYPDEGLANLVRSDGTLNISAQCLMASSSNDTITIPMVSETTSVFQAPQNKEESTSFTFQPQATSIYQFPNTTEMSGVKLQKEEYRLVDPNLMFTTNDTLVSLSSPQFITGNWISTNIVGQTENRQKSRRKMKRKHSFRSLDDIIHKLSVDGNKQLQCPDCHKRFADLCQLERHVKIHKIGTVQQEVVDGTAIDLSNSSITVLCSTSQSEEVQLSSDAMGGSFSCCGIAFNTELEMSHHLKSHNTDTGAKAVISNCPSCNQGFDNQQELRLHKCTQYTRRSYMCSVCGLLLPSLNCYNLHRKIHHEHN